jgi:hypothetical protein
VDLDSHAIRHRDKNAVDQLDDPDASLRKSNARNDTRDLKIIKGGLPYMEPKQVVVYSNVG